MYTVRKYIKNDIDKVVNLWIRNQYFKGLTPQMLKKHLLWKYDQRFTKLWVVQSNMNIIGSCGKIVNPFFIKRDKIIVNGDWGIDSLVDRGLDKKDRLFIFLKVFRNVLLEDYRKKEQFLGFCFPNDVVKKTYLKIGWIDLGVFWRFTKNIFPVTYKKNIGDSFSLEGIKFLKIKRFKRKWDNLWEELCWKYSSISLRDSYYLNWRYFESPTKEYTIFLGKKNGFIKGYVVLRERVENGRHYGYIVDLLVEPENKWLFKMFITAALLFFKNKGVNLVHFYLSYKPYKIALLKLGFLPVKRIDFFIYGKDSGLVEEVLRNKNNLFVTAGDGDFEIEF